MIIERNIFHLKFGHAREALAAMKDMMATAPFANSTRMLTDESGDSYRLILELSFNSYTDMEAEMKKFDMSKWREKYQNFIPHCERSYREFLRVVE